MRGHLEADALLEPDPNAATKSPVTVRIPAPLKDGRRRLHVRGFINANTAKLVLPPRDLALHPLTPSSCWLTAFEQRERASQAA
jgi:hypothetical protein